MRARWLRTVGSLALLSVVGGCAEAFYMVPIETRMWPMLDLPVFQRVLVAGFIAGETDGIDLNVETARLLRSQVRLSASRAVADMDPLALIEIAAQSPSDPAATDAAPLEGQKPDRKFAGTVHDLADLAAYEPLFANTVFWKRLGEEYQQPLIVTGVIVFAPEERQRFVDREKETFDSVGRRAVSSHPVFAVQPGYALAVKFILLDGRTGTLLHSASFREEIFYSAAQEIPPLSAYFQLMDRVIPRFVGGLTEHTHRDVRFLVK